MNDEELTTEEKYVTSLNEIERKLYHAMSVLDVLRAADLDGHPDVAIDEAVVWNVAEVVRDILEDGQHKLDLLRSDVTRRNELLESMQEHAKGGLSTEQREQAKEAARAILKSDAAMAALA